ncbi:bifunctional dihydropteridine reductase/dihydrofolate reductase TmpR [Meiothermus taiwanensis]|jgi:3-oxoacyl-[acyl-carrier protein] reductase|uniref:3-oxoacyl-[acyl-carrier-protein] reductase FabG n=2 Tax=Meiothermus taiwanensis TaxID=172827 RepID=A0A399E0A0_9DEIN|nr:bifunctional dihydropteridine reductase/dihydrofolate reductase TmpR [Meiothermus taiwanensis]AWR86002.1 short-chain dehydrogenase/reductase SDR [Meiothermus taiwanensis WR-220]KIQ53907.1 diguanylate cyclase [Meiothermus taiwanensis]KZK15523.1 diguanylate cyclase [Meiothermus taiwanensis]RIH75641.1 3-oxoacyl-[acyl-carrier-protein] reductase FabG [Meiothermus taiwanensis]
MSRVALVTGSARGIGRAIVLALARQGFDVAVHYHQSALEAEQTRQEALQHGVRAIRVQADVTRVKEAQGLIEEVAEQLGGLQVLVNNVGNYLKKPIEQTTPEEWHSILDSNLNAPFYLTQAALPYLSQTGYGRVVNIGFAGAQNLLARPEITPYVIAKTGLILYSKALAQRLAPRGITVNVVAPGVAENSLSKPINEIPMGRLAQLEELARAVLFFVDEQSSYITGQVMEVSGGWNL